MQYHACYSDFGEAGWAIYHIIRRQTGLSVVLLEDKQSYLSYYWNAEWAIYFITRRHAGVAIILLVSRLG